LFAERKDQRRISKRVEKAVVARQLQPLCYAEKVLKREMLWREKGEEKAADRTRKASSICTCRS
jgi:hypothetical protein